MIVLTLYSLKRAIRHRAVSAGVFGLPAACGFVRLLLPDSRLSLDLVWGCLVVSAAVACAAVLLQRAIDEATGLSDAIRNTPAVGVLAGCRFLCAVALVVPSAAVLVLTTALSR